MSEETWRCDVCREERRDAVIAVRKRYVLIGYGRTHMEHNIKFCNDRAACVEGARILPFFGDAAPTAEEIDAADRELVVVRDLHDGRELTVQNIGASQGRLTVGQRPSQGYYADAYDYPTIALAWRALLSWDGYGDAPLGWTRHLGSGRRREDGDPARERIEH